ncbi:hypothetical protein AB0K49_18290 [Streptomyces decoyicus]|uniref:hypothetical protein n=1 Tax=Streptomyces TaxID=1883 RepID=UPI0020206A13|nr:hypothetical protein [Streptomyces sp. MCA2]MCL7494766.1 hypothetical protein [Streptomyces sp. MCA2]
MGLKIGDLPLQLLLSPSSYGFSFRGDTQRCTDGCPHNCNDCRAWAEFGAQNAVGATLMIADGGHQGKG